MATNMPQNEETDGRQEEALAKSTWLGNLSEDYYFKGVQDQVRIQCLRLGRGGGGRTPRRRGVWCTVDGKCRRTTDAAGITATRRRERGITLIDSQR